MDCKKALYLGFVVLFTNLPVKTLRVKISGGEYHFIYPSARFAPIDLAGISAENIEVDTSNYYIGLIKPDQIKI